MWWPTNLRGRAALAGLRLLLPVLVLCCLSGCGYNLAADSPSVVGDGTKTLKVKGVDYPTLQPWLPYAIRSALRDELGARHLAKWVDSGPADYEIQINVLSFTMREWMRSELDTTMLFSASLVLEGIVYQGTTNQEIWRSGPLYYSDTVENSNEKAASGDLITQTVRLLADRMRRTF